VTDVAYVVLAHRSPRQLRALIRAVAPGRVYLHIDRRTPEPLARALAGLASPQVTLVPRLATRWASWTIVEAILSGMRTAVDDGATHVVAMSGQCLPLAGHEAVSGFLEEAGPVSFLRSHPVPSWNYGRDGGMDRFRGWHRPVRGRDVRLPLPNPTPPGLLLRLGSFQCVVDAHSVRSLLSAAESPIVRRFFSRAWIPDETFMHSVLATTRAAAVVSENLWYMHWSSGDQRHPSTFGDADVEGIAAVAGRPSDVCGYGRAKLFARKFDLDADGPGPVERLQDSLRVSYL
jgi:hypothetical protein